MDLINKMVSCPATRAMSPVFKCCAIHILDNFCFISFPQGQTAFDVADEDVLGYLEELQKKQNLVSQCRW